MTRKDLKKYWPILKALKKGWIDPIDVHCNFNLNKIWEKNDSIKEVFYDIYRCRELKITKEGKEKINKAKK